MKKLQNLKEKIELVLQENGFNEDIEFRISNIKKYENGLAASTNQPKHTQSDTPVIPRPLGSQEPREQD